MQLRLASKSAARRAMLDAAGVRYDLADADLDEESAKARLRAAGTSGPALALALAEAKALAVHSAAGDFVLGADQTLETEDGLELDKPASPEHAREQLMALSGRTHRLHSAAVVVEAGEVVWSACETVALTMRPLSEAFVSAYVAEEYEAIRWSVGGYLIEGRGVQLFDRIDGSHFAILGLPLLPLLGYLRARQVLPS